MVWTEKEKFNLSAIYATASSIELLNQFPGRSLPAIRRYASRLGLRKRNEHHWTDREMDILINNYSKMKVKYLAELLPGRSLTQIYDKAQSLQLSAYDNTDIDTLLRQEVGKKSISSIARQLGRNFATVRYRAARLGLI